MKKTITLLTSLVLIGCGSRKSSVLTTENKTQTETKANQTEAINTELIKAEVVEVQKDIITQTKENNFEITPIDSSKESTAEIDGQTFKLINAKLTNVKKDVLSKDNSKIVENYQEQLKQAQKRENAYIEKVNQLSKNKNKQTDRKSSIWWIILIPANVYVAYLLFKKTSLV